MDSTSQLKNLIIMAAADGEMADSELMFLAERCHRMGLTIDDFQQLFKEVTSGSAKLELPTDYQDQTQLLRDLLRLMAADGRLSDTEKRLFASAAVRMGISTVEIDEVISQMLAEMGRVGTSANQSGEQPEEQPGEQPGKQDSPQ